MKNCNGNANPCDQTDRVQGGPSTIEATTNRQNDDENQGN